ncbi:MAG: hypothetical protein Fur0018_25740 [Anaerolineales bacterium]
MKRRPLSVTILALGVLTLAALYLTRIFVTLQTWNFLLQYALPWAGVYLLGSGLLWSGLLFAWGLGLWRGKPAAHRLLIPLSTAYTLFWWAERLYQHWQNAPAVNHPFWLGITMLVWGWLGWLYHRPATRAFFGVLHE